MFFGKGKVAAEMKAALEPLCAKAETCACGGEHLDAARNYADAWQLLAKAKGGVKAVGEEYAFWLLMNCVNSEWLSGNYEEAMAAIDVTHRNLRGKSFGPVGNPFFHLRVGQCLWRLAEADGEDPAAAGLDNLARAMICGGIEMYSGEPEHYLNAVTAVLDPPSAFATWQASRGDYVGACNDLLNGSFGYVRSVLGQKFGKLPPY